MNMISLSLLTQRFWVQLAQKYVTGYCPGKSHNKFKEKKEENILYYTQLKK